MRLIMKLEGRARHSFFVLIYNTESMASFDSFPSEADRMAQGACDGLETTRPDYVSSGDFIGTGPDTQTAPNQQRGRARGAGGTPSHSLAARVSPLACLLFTKTCTIMVPYTEAGTLPVQLISCK